MGVDHRGLQVGVAQQILDGADIISGLKQVGGKRVPQGVDSHPLGDTGCGRCSLDMSLKGERVDVVPSYNLRSRIHRQVVGRKDPLPDPLFAGIRVFALQGVAKPDAGQVVFSVLQIETVSHFRYDR